MTKIRSSLQEPQLNLGIMVRLYYWSYLYNSNNNGYRPAIYNGNGIVEFGNGIQEIFDYIEEWYYIKELEPENDI